MLIIPDITAFFLMPLIEADTESPIDLFKSFAFSAESKIVFGAVRKSLKPLFPDVPEKVV